MSKCKWTLRLNPELTSSVLVACQVESFEIRSTKSNLSSVRVIFTVVVPNLNLWYRNFQKARRSTFTTKPTVVSKELHSASQHFFGFFFLNGRYICWGPLLCALAYHHKT